MRSAFDKIMRRARARGRGSVFTPSELLDWAAGLRSTRHCLNSRRMVDCAGSSMDFTTTPIHSQLGLLTPTPDAVAKALARETG